MSIICANEITGMGKGCSSGTPFTQTKRVFLSLADQEFTTLADFMDEDKWNEAVAAETLFPMDDIMEVEDMATEGTVYEAADQTKVARTVYPKRGYKLWLYLTVDQHKALWGMRGKNLRIYKVDDVNNVRATSPDGTKVRGFKILFFDVEPMKDATAEKPALTAVTIQEGSIDEWEANGIWGNPDFDFSDITPIIPITLSCSTIASNSVTGTVSFVQNSSLTNVGVKKSAPVAGVLAANVKMIDQDGVAEVVTVTALVNTGTAYTYTFAGVSITAGTCQIIPTATLKVKSNVVILA